MGMAAGELNRQIMIEEPSGELDALNQSLGNWTFVAVEWSKILGATGMGAIRQADTAGIARSINAYSFRIRYNRTYNVNQRVVFDGEHFDIRQIRHDHANHEWTDLICESGGNDG